MGRDGVQTVLGHVLASDVDDDVIRVLARRERRYVCYYLLDHERVSLEELADVLAGWIAATDHRATTEMDRQSLRTALYHSHLPQLADAGLVEFDRETATVTCAPLDAPVRGLVEAAYVAEHRTGDAD